MEEAAARRCAPGFAAGRRSLPYESQVSRLSNALGPCGLERGVFRLTSEGDERRQFRAELKQFSPQLNKLPECPSATST
jgi:hypothetical protein